MSMDAWKDKWVSEDGSCTLYLGDCLEVMATLGDASVDMVMTDPPYGIGADVSQSLRAGKCQGKARCASRDYGITNWDNERPPRKAFDAMMRVSSNQIIFGG